MTRPMGNSKFCFPETLLCDLVLSLFYAVEKSIAFDCTHEEKRNVEGFTENGCYGNQPQPFEA